MRKTKFVVSAFWRNFNAQKAERQTIRRIDPVINCRYRTRFSRAHTPVRHRLEFANGQSAAQPTVSEPSVLQGLTSMTPPRLERN